MNQEEVFGRVAVGQKDQHLDGGILVGEADHGVVFEARVGDVELRIVHHLHLTLSTAVHMVKRFRLGVLPLELVLPLCLETDRVGDHQLCVLWVNGPGEKGSAITREWKLLACKVRVPGREHILDFGLFLDPVVDGGASGVHFAEVYAAGGGLQFSGALHKGRVDGQV
jgi:hypothetical protein